LTITKGYDIESRSFQRGNNDNRWARPTELFTRNLESWSWNALASMVSLTGDWDTWKVDIPMNLAMAMAMLISNQWKLLLMPSR
jgi:hypothetical protein